MLHRVEEDLFWLAVLLSLVLHSHEHEIEELPHACSIKVHAQSPITAPLQNVPLLERAPPTEGQFSTLHSALLDTPLRCAPHLTRNRLQADTAPL